MKTNRCNPCRNAGFTLIEFAVVAAIVALVVAIALPFYKNHRAQSKANEIFSLAADQMAQFQQHASTGAPFDVVSNNVGNYIAVAEITGNGGVAQAGGANGVVFIQLNTDSETGAASIDPALSGLQMTFAPQNVSAVATEAPSVEAATNVEITPGTETNATAQVPNIETTPVSDVASTTEVAPITEVAPAVEAAPSIETPTNVANVNINWVCTFKASTTSDAAKATKLLSSGNCVAAE